MILVCLSFNLSIDIMTDRVCVCRTCASAHAPGRQPVLCGEAIKHANILRCKKLHKLSILEHVPFAIQDGGSLV